jgi:hypothetical protein
MDEHSQLCIYVRDECIIDVIMSPLKDKSHFKADHKCPITSRGKLIASILLARLVDQKLISYEDKIPEIGLNMNKTERKLSRMKMS